MCVWGGGGSVGARFGYMHNEIPRVIPPVCQGPEVKPPGGVEVDGL